MLYYQCSGMRQQEAAMIKVERTAGPLEKSGFGASGGSERAKYKAVGAGTFTYTPTNLPLFGLAGGEVAF
jgi:hypothetical protein